MKSKYILRIALVLLMIVLVIMFRDLFYSKGPNQSNPYEYNLDSLKKVSPDLIAYEEIKNIRPETDYIFGIAIDKDDQLYIAATKEIIIYNKKLEKINSIPLDDDAYCINISDDGKIYIGMADHIEVYHKSGKQLSKWNSKGGQAIFTSIGIDSESVYVADAGNKIIYRYDHEGFLQNEIGKKDTLNGIPGFIIPSPYFDLLIGRNQELWVVNPGRHQLESYRPDGSLISSWNNTSMSVDGFSGCCNPSHIAMLSNGSFVTSEKGIERVKIHLPNGDFKCVVASSDKFLEGTTDLDLAVDSKDRIFVADPKKGLIRIFEKIN